MKGPFRLLVLYGLVTLGTSQVEVDQFVNVNRGQEVTLRCVYTGTHIPASITWRKVNGDSSVRIAVALPSGYRIDNSTFYGRLNFTNFTSELRNGSIRIEDIRLGDEGDFTCMFATLDVDVQAIINLTVNVPPKVSLELNPNNLVDGMGLITVATCVAQEGKPAASITWSGLHQGSSNETTEVAPNGTVMVRSRYWLEPTYESHGRTLTCRVEHPALDSPVEYSTTLNIHYKPRVSIAGYDGDWYVEKEGASLTCKPDGNPNITHYLWDRQNGSLPNGTVVSGNSLSFERPLVESDSGSFSCWANNSVGWGEAVVIITIRSGTTTAATTTATTTTATTTTTSTMPVAATTPGGGNNGGGGGSDEPWVIAVAVIVPLLVLAAVAGSVFFCLKKKRIQAMSTRRRGRDASGGSAHQPSQQQQQHQQQDDHHQYEYIDGKFPSNNLELQQPPPGSAEFNNAHAEITSNWNNHREHLDEKNLNSTESNPQNQEGVHYQPLKPTTEKTYEKLNHPTYENV